MHINLFNLWRLCDPTLNFPKLCSFIEITSTFWQIHPQLSYYECNLLEIKCIYLKLLSFHVYIAVKKEGRNSNSRKYLVGKLFFMLLRSFIQFNLMHTSYWKACGELTHYHSVSICDNTLTRRLFSLFIEFKCLDD